MSKAPAGGRRPHGARAAGDTELTAWLALAAFDAPVRVSGSIKEPSGTLSADAELPAIRVGDVIAQLVSWAQPGRRVSFDAPWDRLLDLTVPPVKLEFESKRAGGDSAGTSTISIAVGDLDVDFSPFLKLTGLTVAYTHSLRSVSIALSGEFLGQPFGPPDSPLSWDVLNQRPPAVPTAAEKILELRYLGVGQRVKVEIAKQNPTLAQVMEALEASFTQAAPDTSPLSGVLSPDPAGGWLAGIDFTALGVLTLQALFDDPQMYGLHLALAGPKAGAATGLSFDILYRKVAENLGVWHAELALPQAARHIELGEVSITLPTIGVDVYTNGDFLIDLGFPYRLDFSGSFAVQMLPFVGAGGLYFGLLDQQTAPALPKLAAGMFSPVIAFGVGLQVGVGKTVNEGVLSGGITVSVQGLLEGVVAGWRPGSGADVAEVYYRITGQISISGHLYGSIDFAIIRASVDVYAFAGAAIVMESHQATLVTLNAGVEVSVSLKVVFFTIHLSFSATIEESFQIGSASAAPWDRPAAAQITAARARPRLTQGDGPGWHVADLVVAGVRDTVATVKVGLAPQVTFGEGGGAEPGKPETQLLALCFTDADVPAGIAGACAESSKSFAQLAEALLQWAFTLAGGSTIEQAALESLFQELAAPEDAGGVPAETILAFLVKNVAFEVLDGAQLDPDSCTVFPVPPWLSLTAGTYACDFAAHAPATPEYRDALAAYFSQLDPSPRPNRPAKRHPAEATVSVPGSLAAVLLADYCKLILRGLLGDALRGFAGFTAEADDGTPTWLAWLVERYGLGADGIARIALANQTRATFRSSYTIAGARALVRAAESVQAFCRRASIAVEDLASACATAHGFLSPAATVTIEKGTYTVVRADVCTEVAGEWVSRPVDMLAVLAERFDLSPASLAAENPACDWTALSPGEEVRLPRLTRANGDSTLAEMAMQFGLSCADILATEANAQNTSLLTPLFPVKLPQFEYRAARDETPLAVAQRFGIALVDLVSVNDGPRSEFGDVVLAGAARRPAQELQSLVLGDDAVRAAAGTVARFLLHGLRLPAPDGTSLGASTGLYELSGQQWPAPANPAALTVELTVTSTSGLDLPSISFPQGAPLRVKLDAEAVQLIQAYESPPTPPFASNVEALTEYPPYAVVPRRYPLGHAQPWQRARPWSGGGSAALPMLYPLPQSLLGAMARAGEATGAPLRPTLVDPGVAGASKPSEVPVTDGRWATKATFHIRRVRRLGGPGSYASGMYEIVSSVGDASSELLSLIKYVSASGRNPTVELLYSAGPQAGDAQGLRSDAVDASAVTLLKANLSTVTAKPGRTADSEETVLVDATMDEPAFLTLLWECSTVNAGGYFLRYGASPDVALPESLFEAAPVVTLTALVWFADDSPDADLLPFHNTLVTTANTATSKLSLVVEPRQVSLPAGASTISAAARALGRTAAELGAANATSGGLLAAGTHIANGAFEGRSYTVQVGDDLLALAQLMGVPVEDAAVSLSDTPGLLASEAMVWPDPAWVERAAPLPPGVVGFRMTRANPDPASAHGRVQAQMDDPLVRLATSYHLLGYAVGAGGGLTASHEAMPVAPTSPPGGTAQTPSPWRYQQILALASLLDPPDDSPYAAVGGTATIALALQDVYGNRCLPAGDPRPLTLPILYHDPIVAFSAWPMARLLYEPVAVDNTAAAFYITLELDAASTVAAAGSDPAAVASRAVNDHPRYALAAAQLARPEAAVALTTTLAAAEQPLSPEPFAAFARQARDYLCALTAITPAMVDAGDLDLMAVAQAHGVNAAVLAQANQDAPELFGQAIVLPVMASAVQNDTLKQFLSRAHATAEAFAQANANMGLAPEVKLSVDSKHTEYTTVAGDTLASVADRFETKPTALAALNLEVVGLYAAGTVLVASTKTAQPGTQTLRTLAATAATTVSVIAELNLEVPLSPGTRLVLPGRMGTALLAGLPATHTVRKDETFAAAAVAAGASAKDLIAASAYVDGLLTAGLSLRFSGLTVPVRAGDTLASVVARFVALGVQVDAPTLFTAAGNDPPGMLVTGTVLPVPPARVVNRMRVTPVLADPIVPLGVGAVITRTANVDPHLALQPGVVSAASPATPAPGAFAADFEAAFAPWNLALATGVAADGSQRSPPLFAVQIAARQVEQGLGYEFDGQHVTFAVPPVSTQPWSPPQAVRISSYESGIGLVDPTDRQIHGADLDAWQRRALADLDRFLDPAVVLAAHALDRQAVRDLVNAKYVLAGAVSQTVEAVLEPAGDMWSGDLGAARETMRQLMLVEASQCYTTNVLVQSHATTQAPATASPPPRLNGKPVSAGGEAHERRWIAAPGMHLGGLLAALAGPAAGRREQERFGELNRDRRLAAGQIVNVGKASVQVDDGDTLADVAAAAHTTPGALVAAAPDALAAAGSEWRMPADPPPTTLTAAKLALAGGDSSITFGLRVANPSSKPSVQLELQYLPSELEYGITPVSLGYEQSSWLTFALPRKPSPLGTAVIPLPLRAFPPAPRITSQLASQRQPPLGPLWNGLTAGDFQFSWIYDQAGQDSVKWHVERNPASGAVREQTDLLAPALAQYQAVADALWGDLSQLPLATPGASADVEGRLTIAVQVFSRVVSAVAKAWEDRPPPTPPPRPRGREIRAVRRPDGSVRLIEPATTGKDEEQFALVCKTMTTDGVRHLLCQRSEPTHGGPFDTRTDQRLWGVVDVYRNTALVYGRETNPDFVYRLLNTRASAPATPLFNFTGDLDLRDVPRAFPGAALVDFLRNMFSAVLGVTPQETQPRFFLRTTAIWEFGFGSAAPLESPGGFTVPVPAYTGYAHAFTPSSDLGARSGYAWELASALVKWQATNSPPLAAAQWTLRLVVHTIDSGGISSPGPPLIDLQRIVLPLSAVSTCDLGKADH